MSAQAYPFLAQPPHAQNIYTPHDAPSARHARRRSLAAISNWASHVQPGAPAPLSPSKPHFAESSRAPELRAQRRHSVKPAPPPPMEYIPDSPSSSAPDGSPASTAFKAPLRPAEYAPVYVQLPHADAPKGRGLRLRGLVKPRADAPPKDAKETKEQKKERKEHEKRERRRRDDVPMQLATELALAQLLGGGTLEHHLQQAAAREAKRAGVRDAYRDEHGRVWRDRDEAWEYEALVGARGEGGGSPASSVESYDARQGRSRRRPEPLDLAGSRPSSSARRHHAEDARREFLESSFVPPVPASEGKRSGLLNMFKSSKKGGQ